MQSMKATKRVDETIVVKDENPRFHQVMRKSIVDALKRDLHMSDKVDVLQGITPLTQPKNMIEIAYFECIDNAEFDDYEDAVANSPDPNAARRAYSANPKPFYVKVTCSGSGFNASMLEKADLEKMKRSKERFVKVNLS